MKHKNGHLLVGYWERLCGEDTVPQQSEIDPRAIKRILSHVFIVDGADAAHPRYRLAGTSLCERFGFELKGTEFLSGWEGQSAVAVAAALAEALKTREPVCISSVGATVDCGMAELETVLVPVSFGGAVTRFVGVSEVLGDMLPLGGRPIVYQRLISARPVREGEPEETAVAEAVMRPRLRLVVSQNRPFPNTAGAAHGTLDLRLVSE
jgi:hypothetical protein